MSDDHNGQGKLIFHVKLNKNKEYKYITIISVIIFLFQKKIVILRALFFPIITQNILWQKKHPIIPVRLIMR